MSGGDGNFWCVRFCCVLYFMSSFYLCGVGLFCGFLYYFEDSIIVVVCFFFIICVVIEFLLLEKLILGIFISSKAYDFYFLFELFCVKIKRFWVGCKIVILSFRVRVFFYLNGEYLW